MGHTQAPVCVKWSKGRGRYNKGKKCLKKVTRRVKKCRDFSR